MSLQERDRRRRLQEMADLRAENRRLRELLDMERNRTDRTDNQRASIIQILERHIEPAFTCLLNGKITSVNEILRSRLGFSRQSLTGANILDFIDRQDRQIFEERLHSTDFGDPEVNYEFRLTTSDSTTKWYQWARAPISHTPENGPEILLIGRDVTELKNAQFLAMAQRDLSVALNEASSEDEALGLCVESVLDISRMDAAGVYLFDDDYGLHLAKGRGLTRESAGSVTWFGPDSAESALVRMGSPLYFHEGFSEESALLMKELGLKTIALIPILNKASAIGCFILASRSLYETPVFTQRSLETIAAQIGAAIIRARTQETLAKVTEELEESVERRTRQLREVVQSLKQEVEDRERAEQSLIRSEREYRTLFENLRDGWISTTLDGKFTNCNAEFEKMIGYTLDQIKGLNHSDVTPAKWLQMEDEIIRGRLLKDGYSGVYEKEYIRKDGEIFPVELAAYLQRDLGGEPTGIWGLVRDITERKRAEKEIQRLGAAVEQAAEIIFITDTKGKILYVNPAFERTTGYSAEQALGKTPRILKSGKHSNSFYEDMWATIQQGMVWKGRITNRRRDGALYEEEAAISPIRDEQGRIVNFVAVKRDITNEIALERHLRQAQKMEAIGTLAGGIAHDFNNLLQVIVGYTQMAMREPNLGDRAGARLEQVFNAGIRATELVKQILSFSRQVDREKGPVQMGPIVKETCKFLEASTPANIEIRVEVEENLDLIMADPTQMHQVIMNLGTNAVQAMPPKGGVVEVLLKNAPVQAYSKLVEHGLNPGKHVELTVKDNGAGIPSHLYERLFEPYFTTKPMSEGAGLGLAVAHGIVTAHNGIILLNSRIGSGSRFTVYIPSISKSAALSETPERPVPTGKERILFVDDEAAIVEISGEMLEDLGYDTVTQTDAIQALNLFKSDPNRFDLVITDMSMPRLSGLEFAAEIIALRPEIPVVICTGFSSRLNEEEARQLGVRAFLLKPILRNQLAQTIRSVLDKEHMTC